MPRVLAVLSVLILAIAVPLAAQETEGKPEPARRSYVDLFRPLDLPGPSERRLATGVPGPEYWQQQSDYRIEATLDAGTRRITGHEVITYTNHSPHPLEFVWLSLDQNIFRPDSRAAQGSERGSRVGRTLDEGLGFTIESLTCGGRPAEPAVYDTLARVECPEPVAPRGGRLVIEIRWSFTIPSPGMRMGVVHHKDGDVFALANWFPAVAVYDDVHGWNTLPYLGRGEFYQGFGNYEVALTVPRDHIVAATGVLQNAAEVLTPEQIARLEQARAGAETILIRDAAEAKSGGGRPAGEGPLTWRFTAERVRTFAWASCAAFLWDAAGLDGAVMQSFYPPDALPLWTGATQMLRSAIDGFNRRWFHYPYPSASNVNGLGPGGGMEYPMIIFNGRESTERGLYFLIAHEIGHQWFPMVVNSDERRHPWMDEGFNTFIDYYAMIDRFGAAGSQFSLEAFRAMSRTGEKEPVMTPPDRGSGASMGFNAYHKPARVLIMLREQVLGAERFDRAFRDYIRHWAFKHPQPADFFRCIENGAGEDLSWFWRQWFFETGGLDQAVTKAEVQGSGEDARARITFRSLGEAVMPLPYTVTFADGTTMTGTIPVDVWGMTDRKTVTIPLEGRKPAKVEIDPGRQLPDVDRGNNLFTFDS